MKSMTKILVIALSAVFFLTAFTACGVGDTSDDNKAATTVPETTTTAETTVTTAPETTTAPPATTTTAPPVTTVAPKPVQQAQAKPVAPKPAAVAPPKAPTPTAPTTPTGYNRAFASQLVTLTNQYKAQNGLPTSTSDGGWQLYCDRLVKLMADKRVCQHGPGIYEIVAGGTFDNSPAVMMQAWKNSAGHNKALLDATPFGSGYKGKYICSSVYTVNDGTITVHYSVVVLMDMTYQEYYNSYGRVWSTEEWWWSKNGSYDYRNSHEQEYTQIADSWTEEQFKNYFATHNYGQYYPHLK